MNKTKIIGLLGAATMTTTIVAPTVTPTIQTTNNTKPSDNNSIHNNSQKNDSKQISTDQQQSLDNNKNISGDSFNPKNSTNDNQENQKASNNSGQMKDNTKVEDSNSNKNNVDLKGQTSISKNQTPKAVQLNMAAKAPIEQASLNINNVWEQSIGTLSFNSNTMTMNVGWGGAATTNPYASSQETLFIVSLISQNGSIIKSETFNGNTSNPQSLLDNFSGQSFQYGDKLAVTYVNKSANINATGLNENGTISSTPYNVTKTTAFNIEKTGLSVFSNGKLDVNPLPIEGIANIVKSCTVTGTTTPESEVTIYVGGKTFKTQSNYVGTFSVPITDENGLTGKTPITVCVPGQVPTIVYPTAVPNLGINKASIVTNANCHLTGETLSFNPTIFKMNISESGTNQFSANLISDGVPVAKSQTAYFSGFSGNSNINGGSFKYGDIISFYQGNEGQILWGNTTINTGTSSSTLNAGKFEYYRIEPTGLVPVENKNLTINNPSYGGESKVDVSGQTLANVNVKVSVGSYTTTVKSNSKGEYVASIPSSDMSVGDVVSVYVNGDNFGQIVYNYAPSYALYSSKIQVSNYYGQPIFNIGFNPADSKFTAAKNITYYNYSGGQETGNTVGTFYTNRLSFKLINSKTGDVIKTFSTNQLNDSSAFISQINGQSFENGDILEVSDAPNLLNVNVLNGKDAVGSISVATQYFEITNAGLVDISNKFISMNPVDILGSGKDSTNITGKVNANANVNIKIGDRTFTGKANASGNFSIPITVANGFTDNTNIIVSSNGYIPTSAKLEYASKVNLQNSFINFYSQGSTSNIQSSIGFDPANMKFVVQNYVDSLGNGSQNYFTLGLYNQNGTAIINPTGINNGSTSAITSLINGKSFNYGDVISLSYNPSMSIPVALNNQSVIANITGTTEYFEITKDGLVRVNFGEKIYTQSVAWKDNNLVMNLAPSIGNTLSLANGKVEIISSSNKVITTSTIVNGKVEFTESQLKNLTNQTDYKFMIEVSGKTLPLYVNSNTLSNANYKLFANTNGELVIETNHINYPISNVNDIASYSKNMSDAVTNAIKNNDSMNSTLNNEKAMNDVVANAFINRFGITNLQKFYSENANNAAFMNWVLNNDVAMSEYLQATNIGAANINSLQIWSDIWNEYTNSHSGFNLRLAIATALANESTIYDCFNGKPVGSPVVRYNIFETLNEQGGMVKGFDTLNVKLLEAVVDVPITNPQIDEMRSLLLQNHNNLVTGNDLSGTDYTINYTFRNPYNGASIFGSWEKFYGPNATVADVFKLGGVCGSISRLGSVACRVFGQPSHQMGEPGHDAFYTYDIQNGQWYSEYGETTVAKATGFDVSGWSNGLALNSYTVTYNAIYAAADNAQLTKSNEYLWMANSALSYNLKLQAINNAIQAQSLNVEAWLAKINLLKSNPNTTAQDYINLANDLMSALKGYPEPMFDLLVKFNKNMLQVATTTQYNDFVNKVTSVLKNMETNGDSSQQTQASRVLNDGYMTQYGFVLNQPKILGQLNINSWQRSSPTESIQFVGNKIVASGIHTWIASSNSTGIKINLFDNNMNEKKSFNVGGEEFGTTMMNSLNGQPFAIGDIVEVQYTPGIYSHGYLSLENSDLVTKNAPNIIAFQITQNGLKILDGPYTAPNGKAYNFYTGFKKTVKGMEYLIFGTPQKGVQTIDGKQYYFNNEGIMQTGLQTINNYGYYFNKDGVMQTGWQTIGNQRYYFSSNGEANPGYQVIDGKQYLFANNGLEIQNAIPNSDMKISSYSTEENNSTYSANNIIDGNLNNNWQNVWNRSDKNPYVTIELNHIYKLNDLICFPRQDGAWNGNILKYKILVSLNGKDFTPVTQGNWAYSYSTQSQFANLNGVKAKYIKIESEDGISNLATISEVVLSGTNVDTPSNVINKTNLEKAISKGSALLNSKNIYTAASLADLTKAIESGEIINKSSSATESQVTNAQNIITNAIKDLKPNKDNLVNEIKAAKVKLVNKDEYSSSTVNALNNELTNAEKVNENADATISEVSSAVKILENSIADLKPNKDGLENEIKEAKTLESN
ncbi:MAG: discoidin domain-containing protein, partial [Sarcina sp.]